MPSITRFAQTLQNRLKGFDNIEPLGRISTEKVKSALFL